MLQRGMGCEKRDISKGKRRSWQKYHLAFGQSWSKMSVRCERWTYRERAASVIIDAEEVRCQRWTGLPKHYYR